ncbi:major facilitator superfamily domain-containing protein [Cunninghamella echinulata]|nr:major facilitator superfamily domain-containing protein [Cunninghamella echinulata]
MTVIEESLKDKYSEDVETPTVRAEEGVMKDQNIAMNWPFKKKAINFAIVFMNGFIGYFSSSIYIPALLSLQTYFNANLTVINSTISLFIVITGVAPLFWSPFSERIGRRWTYIITMLLYTVCSIVCGVSTNLPLFYVFRVLQGVFCAAATGVGGGSVADLFEPHQRGKAMAIFLLGVVLGPSFGPLVGGYVNQYAGWRWIFYILTIIGGVVTLLNIFFLKETLYIDPNVEKPKGIAKFKFNPFTSLNILLTREGFLASLPQAVAFGFFYLLVTSLPIAFGSIYHFSTGSIGLCFLASGVGNCFGTIVSGMLSDRMYNIQKKRNNGVGKAEFRLKAVYVGVPFVILGLLLFGWFLQARTFHWIAPLIGLAIYSFGNMYVISMLSTYMAEGFFPLSASGNKNNIMY